MIPPLALRKLAAIVGEQRLLTEPAALEPFAADATRLAYRPDAVVLPRNADEIAEILRLANEAEFPVIPRGAGTGMSGGALAVHGGLILSMQHFDRILDIDADNLTARAEPGVITADLQKAVDAQGLFYPPDPASYTVSTLGGNVAECAGGLRAVKYGVTRDYILGLTVVLPTGEILNTGVATMKGVAGYDLTRLLIGSEGTLAVITAITVRLIPKPEGRRTLLVLFPGVEAAVRTVSAIIRARIVPAVLELLDRWCLECLRDELGLEWPEGTRALLLVELDGLSVAMEREAAMVRDLCGAHGALRVEAAGNEAEADRLWEARRNASPALYRLRPAKISEDVVVPRSRMAVLVNYLEDLSRRHGLPIPAFGHAGDGNLHVNVMFDDASAAERSRAQAAIRDLMAQVVAMGGTITGEHGIGITKMPFIGLEITPAGLALMRRIKAAFDPKGILNPGKIFPPETAGNL